MKKINQHNDNKKQDTKLFKRIKINHLFKMKSCCLPVKNFEAIFTVFYKKKRKCFMKKVLLHQNQI